MLVDVQQPAKTAVHLMGHPVALRSTIYGVQMAVPRNSPDALPLEVVATYSAARSVPASI